MGRLASQLAVAATGMLLVAVVLTSFAFSAVITEVPDAGGAYVEGLAGFPQALNPVLANDDASRSIVALVFSGLTRSDDAGQPVPDLAESWDISPDGKTYRFVLRPNARWHDGTPVTADDVVFTIKLIQDPQYTGQLAGFWKDVTVEKVDNRTVRFILKESFAPFIEYTSLGLLPSHLLAGVSPRDLPTHRFNVQPVGTGPFRIKEVRTDRIVLEAAPQYYGPRPYLSRIIFRIYPNYKTILTALERDEVEGAPMIEPEDRPRVADDKGIAVYEAPQASLLVLFFNVTQPILSDRLVRQAIACAIDRQKLIEIGRAGHARRADGPVLPGSWAFHPDAKRYDYDPARARALLEQAGWKLESPDPGGVRSKDGRRLRLVLLTNDRKERIRLAEEIQRQLGAVGIEVEVQATGVGGLVQDFLLPRRYELALYSWDFDGFDPDPYALWHSSQVAPQGLNVSGFTNRRADDLLERGRRTADRAERAKLYQEFQTLFAEELPSLPLYYPTYAFAISAKVKGVRPGVIANPADRFRNVAEWYVKTRREVVGRR
jgi:peptide/nickel transport system substrate-binding protein